MGATATVKERVTLRLTNSAATLLPRLAGGERRQGVYVSDLIEAAAIVQEEEDQIDDADLRGAYKRLQMRYAALARLLNPEGTRLKSLHRYRVAGQLEYTVYCPNSGLEHACPAHKTGLVCPGHLRVEAVSITVREINTAEAAETALRALLSGGDAHWTAMPDVSDLGLVREEEILRALGKEVAPTLPLFEDL